MNRPDNLIKSLRPSIPQAETQAAGILEAFQNEVLRPIIKLQHELLIRQVKSQQQFAGIKAANLPKEIFHERVKEMIQNQAGLRNQLIGFILGMMTVDEFEIYQQNATEYNKRITGMITQRICDTFFKDSI